jgi:hypothetical protein
MRWIKHDTDANNDAKLQNVLLDYGLEGYGLYWYCIELIAGKVDKDNITFELEHDARIIARNVGSTAQKVEEMMRYFVKTGLFESSNGAITCFKLARRLDQSMTSNPEMRKIIDSIKNHDGIMTESCKIRLDQTREDKSKDICAVQEELLEGGFEIFYSAGLVKKSKAQAYKKFKSLSKQMKADPIEFGQLLAQDVQTRIAKQQYGIDKLHPSTYLNNQRWTDEHEEPNNGQFAPTGKQSAAERINARNNAKYGQPSSGLGMGESSGDLRGAMGEGERRNAITYVETSAEQDGSISCEGWD